MPRGGRESRESRRSFEDEIEERRQALMRTPPRKESKRPKSEPSFSKVKLRKTGRQLTGVKSEEPPRWSLLSWLSLENLCGGSLCFPEAEEFEEPAMAHISTEITVCGACGERIYSRYDRFDDDGTAYHKGCVKCDRCQKSLLPASKSERRKFMCGSCTAKIDDEKRRSLTSSHVIGQTQEQAGTRKGPDAKGDVAGVLDAIGDDLEEAYRSAVPRCLICGGTYSKTDTIHYVIDQDRRIPKYHQECYRLGRPKDGVIHSAPPPRLAAKNAPSSIVLKVLDANNGGGITLFFDRLEKKEVPSSKHHTKKENEAPASVDYTYVPPTLDDRTAKIRRESLLGSILLGALTQPDVAHFFKIPDDPSYAAVSIDEDVHANAISVLLIAHKARLRYELRLTFPLDDLQLQASPKAANLRISIPTK